MKSRVLVTPVQQTTTFKNGVVQVGRDSGSAITRSLRVYSQVKSGNKKDPNPFGYWKVDAVGLQGHCSQLDPDDRLAYATGGFPSEFDSDGEAFGSSTWMYTQAYNEAVARFVDQYRGGLDLSIDLFQGSKTLATAKQLAFSANTLATSLKKIAQGGSKGAAKEFGNKWLMWIYGVKPTMQSLYELVQKLNQEAKAGSPLVHIRARGSCIEKKTVRFTTTGFGYQLVYGSASVDNSVRCQLDIYLKAPTGKIQTLAGYTSLNPASIAWELMPFSFVVDWFYNIGGFLRSAETALVYSRNFHSGTVTYSQSKESNCITPNPKGGTVQFTGLSAFHVYRVHERQVLNGLPSPKVPRLQAKLGSTRLLNAAALLSQFLGDPPRRRKT